MDPESMTELLDVNALLSLPPQRWLIQDILPEGEYSVLWGPSGQGKSFVALDWAVSIALGRAWQGEWKTMQAPVIYIAAEGGAGMQKRVKALMTHYGVTEIPGLYFRIKPLYVRDNEEMEAFVESLEALDMWPGMIVIDTLSRSFGAGEENASTDMGFFVDNITKMAKDRGCTVLVVHHSNATGSRERGHTSLKAGAQAQLECRAELTKEGYLMGVTVRTSKQKDARHADGIYLKASPCEDSLVLIKDTPPEKPEKSKDGKPSIMDKASMLTVLEASEDGYTWKEWQLAARVPKSMFNRRIKQMMAVNEVYKDGGKYYASASLEDLAEVGSEE